MTLIDIYKNNLTAVEKQLKDKSLTNEQRKKAEDVKFQIEQTLINL